MIGAAKGPGRTMNVTLADVETAARRLDGAVLRTPFLLSQTLSQLTGAEIWLKFENLQFTGSFKERGALNKLLTLGPDARRRGVVTVSAGNHAQGVALHARKLGIPATILMPESTPTVKIRRTESFGAAVRLVGRDFDEASTSVAEFVRQGLTFIHPFDDPEIIAGQGTIGLEMIAQGPVLDTVIVSVGGGGMIAGIASTFAALAQTTQVVGVESELYPSMARATNRYAGNVVGGATIAEGIAVTKPGALTLEHVARLVDDILVVPEAVIEDAVALLLQIEKTLCEGAGAAGLAAVLARPERFRGKRIGLVLSGGNIDMRVLTAMLQRHLVRSGQLVRLRVPMLDNAGSLGPAASIIGAMGGNILEVTHDRIFDGASARSASAVFTVELPDSERNRLVLQALHDAGFAATVVAAHAAE